MPVAVGLPFKGLKEPKPAELFIQALVRLVKPPAPAATLLPVRPHQRRHLSLNTPLMKVIHFNGASFQTPVIKACGALDWEVVETARGPLLQINSHASSPRPKPAGEPRAQNHGNENHVFQRRRNGRWCEHVERIPELLPLIGSKRWRT